MYSRRDNFLSARPLCSFFQSTMTWNKYRKSMMPQFKAQRSFSAHRRRKSSRRKKQKGWGAFKKKWKRKKKTGRRWATPKEGGGGKADVRHLCCCLGLETDAIVNSEVLTVVNEYKYSSVKVIFLYLNTNFSSVWKWRK